MSQIAVVTGIGRAMLYAYFPDIEAILLAWHQPGDHGHLDQLAHVRDQAAEADQRLKAYAVIAHESHGHRDSELAAFLHRSQQVTRAEQLREMLQDLLTQVRSTGKIRGDVTPSDLAGYCLHALAEAGSLPSGAAVRRLVTATVAGLRLRGAPAPAHHARADDQCRASIGRPCSAPHPLILRPPTPRSRWS